MCSLELMESTKREQNGAINKYLFTKPVRISFKLNRDRRARTLTNPG